MTGPQGLATETVVFKDDGRGEEIDLGGHPARVVLGSIKMPLPYSLHLDDFLLINYPPAAATPPATRATCASSIRRRGSAAARSAST